MKTNRYHIFFATLSLTLLTAACNKSDNNLPNNSVYFPSVKAIIQNNCTSCHLSNGAWSGRPTKFDSDADITSTYLAIKRVVADPVTITNKRMPQGAALSNSDIDIIVKWFDKGGKSTD